VDDAAYQVPQGRYSGPQCVELAQALEGLALALKAYAASPEDHAIEGECGE
jgi:hypothetical protein